MDGYIESVLIEYNDKQMNDWNMGYVYKDKIYTINVFIKWDQLQRSSMNNDEFSLYCMNNNKESV